MFNAQDLKSTVLEWKKNEPHLMLVDMVGRDTESGLKLNYFFYFPSIQKREMLEMKALSPHPSLKENFANAEVLERECFDFFGISFEGQKKGWFLRQNGFHPLLKKERRNWNPDLVDLSAHTLIDAHNSLWADLALDRDDKVRSLEFSLGHAHRGFEKQIENLEWKKVPFYLERMNFEAGTFYSVLFHEILEKAWEVALPERARAIRMIMLELTRIKSHLLSLWKVFHYFHLEHYEYKLLALREQILHLSKLYSGTRQGEGFSCVGGTRFDFPKGWINVCQEVGAKITFEIGRLQDETLRNILLSERLGHDLSTAAHLFKYSITGPWLRSHGTHLDLRKITPSYFYSDVDFKIPVGAFGKGQDLVLILMEEILESIKIINQVLDNIPPGLVVSADPRFYIPSKYSLPKDGKELERYQTVWTQELILPQGIHYGCMEGPQGEIGIMLDSAGPHANRIRIRSPHQPMLSFLEDVCMGRDLNEATSLIHLANLNLGEIEK